MVISAGGSRAMIDNTTNSEPRLHPPEQNRTRMPFSSPITEEITSPSSPTEYKGSLESPTKGASDPFASPLPSQNPFSNDSIDDAKVSDDSSPRRQENSWDEVEQMTKGQQGTRNAWAYQASRAAARNALAKHARRYSVGKPGREVSRKKQLCRPDRPGITIITNFAQHCRNPSAAEAMPAKRSLTFPQDQLVAESKLNVTSLDTFSPPEAQLRVTAATPARQRSPAPGGFVSLADLKALDGQPAPISGLTWHGKSRERKHQVREYNMGAEAPAKKPRLLGSRDVARARGTGFKAKTMRPNRQAYQEIDDGAESPVLDPAKQAFKSQDFIDGSENAPTLGVHDERFGKVKGLIPPRIKLEDDLSPSDRPIVIGLSVPSARLEGHALSPHSTSVATPSVSEHGGRARAPSDANSITPTIVITPARERARSSFFTKAESPPITRRIASSIYSQPTPYIGGSTRAECVPCMPAVPAQVYRSDYQTSPFSPGSDATSSAETLFEEDEDEKTPVRGAAGHHSRNIYSPRQVIRGRVLSGSSVQSPGSRSSLDTTTARHPSRGWWNFITTPFVTRSNTVLSKVRGSPIVQRQESPSLAEAATQLQDHDQGDEKFWDKQFSPMSARPKSGHTTIWTDLDWWDDDREKIGVAIDHTPRSSVQNVRSGHRPQESSATIPVIMPGGVTGGAASVEHYDSGHHGLGSNNPYNQNLSTQRDSSEHHGDSISRHSQFSSFSPNDRDVPMLFEGDHHPAANQQSNNPFFQAPSDPFASSFRQAAFPTSSPRSDSGTGRIEVEDEVVASPTIHEARAAPVVVARPPILASTYGSNRPVPTSQTVQYQPDLDSSAPPPYSPPRRAQGYRPYVAVYPPVPHTTMLQQPLSPGPVSPSMQRAMSSRGGIPLAEVAPSPAPTAARQAYMVNKYFAEPRELPPRTKATPVVLADLNSPTDLRRRAEARRKRREKEDAFATKLGGLWRGRGCFSDNGCAGRGGAKSRKRRRWCCCVIFGLVVMIVVIVVLAMTLHRKRDNHPIQSQWLNTTSFPPIPTGISTITQPDAVVQNTGCVHPSTMWSCSLPKEQQQSIAPNAPNQPNFRLEIRFRNDSAVGNSTTRNRQRDLAANPASAGDLIRHRLLLARDVASSILWMPTPSPPALEEQRFLGNTTDHVASSLFEGEATPFYITFLPTTPSPSRHVRRQDSAQPSNTANPFPDLTRVIPVPSLNTDGTPKPATLLALPESQPLRLYDRGLQTEHYGFYNYFDRSIFLKSVKLLDKNDTGEVPADMNGGATRHEASVQCTWTQTRFLVKIWTRMEDSARLLQNTTSASSTSKSSKSQNATGTPANDSSRPGSFPYPVTISLDRHGGDLGKKMIYCYGIDDRGKVVLSDKKMQIEERGFGGVPVNAADGPWGNVTVGTQEGGPGGADGGDGGCSCEWRNWARS